MKYLYTEKYKKLMKITEKDRNVWNGILCSVLDD